MPGTVFKTKKWNLLTANDWVLIHDFDIKCASFFNLQCTNITITRYCNIFKQDKPSLFS